MKLNSLDFKIAPFSDTPDLRMFWEGHGSQQIFKSLLLEIINGAPLQMVTAEPGLGKTVLCRKLLNSLKSHKRRYRALYLPFPHQDFGNAIDDKLRMTFPDQRRTVLLIDEAQALSDKSLIRLISCVSPSGTGQKEMQAVLFGQPELEERLQNVALRSLADLRTSNHQIHPLDREQIHHYLTTRFSRAGADPDALLNEHIIDTVWRASGGIPRIVNIIMRKALLVARSDTSGAFEFHHVLSATKSTDASVS